jgi:exportin-2 (importin alpha re-exporter)
MISVDPVLQSQLGEAISLIADSDFWDRWDTLVDVSLLSLSGILLRISDLPIGARLSFNTG